MQTNQRRLQRQPRLSALAALMLAAGCLAQPALAQTTLIIGDTGIEVVTVPPASLPAFDTLILGNTATGDGTLSFNAGLLDITHAGGYSGYMTVGDAGTGQVLHSNANGAATINITGPRYSGPASAVAPDPWGGYLFIARSDGSNGSYILSDLGNGNALALNVQNEIQIGGSNVSTQPGGGFSCFSNCNGSFMQNGGIVTAGGVTIGIGGGTGSYTINSGTLTSFIDLGNSSGGNNSFTQNGGAVNGAMFIGNGGGSNGTYTMDGGTLDSGSFILLGASGTGAFVQNAGDHVAHQILMGYDASGAGTYTLAGGTLTIGNGLTDQLVVGHNGNGTFNMTGGSLVILNQDLGTNAFIIGNNTGSEGVFNQSGGDLQAGRSITLGGNGGTGTYNLSNSDSSGATTTTLSSGFITLGFSGRGVFNQSAGTRNTTGNLYIGGDNGTYNLSGGELIVNDSSAGSGTTIGTFGTGVFNQTGGSHTANNVSLGQGNGANGTYILSGGSLTVASQLFVGRGDDSARNPGLINGLFQQSDGTVNAGQIIVGGNFEVVPDPVDPINNPPTYVNHYGTGRYELSGGVATSQFTSVGYSSQGRVVQTGGTFNAGVLALGDSGLFADATPSGYAFYSDGTYDLQGGQLNTTGTTVSVFGLGTFLQSGGEHNVTGKLVVGSQPAAIEPTSGMVRQGLYSFSDGVLTVSGDTIIGAGNSGFGGEPGGLGSFTQTGGMVMLNGALVIGDGGDNAGGTGIYSLSGAASQLSVGGDMRVGGAGIGTLSSGTVIQSDGVATVAGGLYVGSGNANGSYALSGSGVLNTAITYVGEGGVARFAQSGGTHNTVFLNIGIFAGSDSIYTMSGGTLNVASDLGIGGPGAAGTAQFNQSAGSVNVNDPNFGLYLGNHGQYNLNGGTLAVLANTTIGGNGGGVFNQSGGAVTTGALILSAASGESGTYNLSGGTLVSAGNVTINSAGAAGLLNVTGGSLTSPLIVNNDQLVYGGGSISANVSNNAQFMVQGGNPLTLVGNLSNNAGAALNVAAGTPLAITGVLTQAATASIVAGANITVGSDYVNAAFGSGNAFDRRADVSGTGLIAAAGAGAATAQTLSGGITVSGTSGNAVLDFGSLRVGQSSTLGYTVGNSNTGGPALRGAIQTSSALGAHITDTRLSGSGVTAGDWGPLAAGSSTGNYSVTFNASSSGVLAGQQLGVVNNFGNTNNQLLAVSGKAYAPAAAQLNTAALDFGIVHVGQAVANATVSVTNSAAPTALNDVLQASIGGAAAPFASSGNLGAGVAAGASNNTGLQVGLNTATAGVFDSSAVVAFKSHNADMADLDLGTQSLTLHAQVNNYAAAAFGKTGGQGTFSGAATSYTLDFGTLLAGAAGLSSQLSVFNTAMGPADALKGSYDLSGITPSGDFTLGGFTSFVDLAAGSALGGLTVAFSSGTLGSFDQVVVLHPGGTNASGYSGVLGDVTLHLTGSVVAVPEPSTYLLMAFGLLGVWLARRRQAQT